MIQTITTIVIVIISLFVALVAALFITRKKEIDYDTQIENAIRNRDDRLETTLREIDEKIVRDKNNLDTINSYNRRADEVRNRAKNVVDKFKRHRRHYRR